MRIRSVQKEDIEQIRMIYAWYIEHTAVCFDYKAPDTRELFARAREITQRYPYLVCEEEGKIAGFCYAHPFVGKDAYQWTCEMTVYVASEMRGHGIGKALYDTVEQQLRAMGIRTAYACIGEPREADDPYLSHASRRFHEKMGYVLCGIFEKCGYKFDRWYDMIWMQKKLLRDDEVPEAVRWQKGEL